MWDSNTVEMETINTHHSKVDGPAMDDTATTIQMTLDELDQAKEPREREQEFQPGDIVVDRHELPVWGIEAIDSAAIVLYRIKSPACISGIVMGDGDMTTVSELNPEYPENDAVYRVGFIRDLDRMAPGWREWDLSEDFNGYERTRGLRHEMIAYQREHETKVRTYDYPVSRLYPAGSFEFPQTIDGDDRAVSMCISDDAGYVQPERN